MIALLKKLARKEEAKEFTLSLWHFIFPKVYFLILIANYLNYSLSYVCSYPIMKERLPNFHYYSHLVSIYLYSVL